MDFKNILLNCIKSPYILDLVISRVFEGSKRFAFQQMEHCLEIIKDYLLDKKESCKASPNPSDDEVLKLGISALKEFSESLGRVLEEVER